MRFGVVFCGEVVVFWWWIVVSWMVGFSSGKKATFLIHFFWIPVLGICLRSPENFR